MEYANQLYAPISDHIVELQDKISEDYHYEFWDDLTEGEQFAWKIRCHARRAASYLMI